MGDLYGKHVNLPGPYPVYPKKRLDDWMIGWLKDCMIGMTPTNICSFWAWNPKSWRVALFALQCRQVLTLKKSDDVQVGREKTRGMWPEKIEEAEGCLGHRELLQCFINAWIYIWPHKDASVCHGFLVSTVIMNHETTFSRNEKNNTFLVTSIDWLFNIRPFPPAGLWQCLTQATSDRCCANCMCAVAMKR